MGITKREAPISWRPSPAARLGLADLIERMGVKRNEVLNLLVIAAAHKRAEKVVGVDPALGEDRGATVRGKVEKGVLTVDSVETGDTRTPQERMDDFYRSNMAKGKK